MKLHDCDCKIAQVYYLDVNGFFNKHAVFVNLDNDYAKALKLLFELGKDEVNSSTSIKKMKGFYYAD